MGSVLGSVSGFVLGLGFVLVFVLGSGLARSPASTSSAVMEEPSPTVSRVLASSAGDDAPAS